MGGGGGGGGMESSLSLLGKESWAVSVTLIYSVSKSFRQVDFHQTFSSLVK